MMTQSYKNMLTTLKGRVFSITLRVYIGLKTLHSKIIFFFYICKYRDNISIFKSNINLFLILHILSVYRRPDIC